MISRVWHGWTTSDNADTYEQLLRREIFPGIAARQLPGYREIQLLRRTLPSGEIEFVTITWFDSWEAVKKFAGDDYEHAVVPTKAQAILSRFDARSQHYDVKEQLSYPTRQATS